MSHFAEAISKSMKNMQRIFITSGHEGIYINRYFLIVETKLDETIFGKMVVKLILIYFHITFNISGIISRLKFCICAKYVTSAVLLITLHTFVGKIYGTVT